MKFIFIKIISLLFLTSCIDNSSKIPEFVNNRAVVYIEPKSVWNLEHEVLEILSVDDVKQIITDENSLQIITLEAGKHTFKVGVVRHWAIVEASIEFLCKKNKVYQITVKDIKAPKYKHTLSDGKELVLPKAGVYFELIVEELRGKKRKLIYKKEFVGKSIEY